MADLLLNKIDKIIDKHFGKVVKEMEDAENNTIDSDTEHDFWGVGMSLANDVTSFKHYKMGGLPQVIDTILDQQSKKRRGTIIKIEVNKRTGVCT